MRRLLILSILLVAAVSVNLKISPMKKVEELKNTKFGRTLLQLISLHSQVRGPIEELLEAIEDLVIIPSMLGLRYQRKFGGAGFQFLGPHKRSQLSSIRFGARSPRRQLGYRQDGGCYSKSPASSPRLNIKQTTTGQ